MPLPSRSSAAAEGRRSSATKRRGIRASWRCARVHASVDPALAPDAARVALLLADGGRIEEQVDHAVGSRLRPMSDQALGEKLAALAAGILPPSRIEKLVDLCWGIEEIADVAAIAAAARPA